MSRLNRAIVVSKSQRYEADAKKSKGKFAFKFTRTGLVSIAGKVFAEGRKAKPAKMSRCAKAMIDLGAYFEPRAFECKKALGSNEGLADFG